MAIFLLANKIVETLVNINDYYFCIFHNISVCFSVLNTEGREKTDEFFRIHSPIESQTLFHYQTLIY